MTAAGRLLIAFKVAAIGCFPAKDRRLAGHQQIRKPHQLPFARKSATAGKSGAT
jgi:hypothetical protein